MRVPDGFAVRYEGDRTHFICERCKQPVHAAELDATMSLIFDRSDNA
jgi:hypothetical protein